jgi:hypothetical protein
MADFNIKIWTTKWAYGLTAVVATTAVAFTAEYVNVTTFPPEYAFLGSIISILLVQAGNAIKHISTPIAK